MTCSTERQGALYLHRVFRNGNTRSDNISFQLSQSAQYFGWSLEEATSVRSRTLVLIYVKFSN